MLTLAQLNELEMRQLKRERETTDPDPEMWRWSPVDIRHFDEMLGIALQLAADMLPVATPVRTLSIAEAGAGIGTKLYLAKHKYELTEMGYEINPEYIRQARELGVEIEMRDLRDLDNQPPWGAFDIVYYSLPFKSDIFEARWERQLQADMRPGAVLIAAHPGVKPYGWTCFYRRPFRGVWVKPDLVDEPLLTALGQRSTV